MAGKAASVDPLLKALIDKLPAQGGSYPHAERLAWLRMMVSAFDVAYGPGEPIGVGGNFGASVAGRSSAEALQDPPQQAAKPAPPHQGNDYYIDAESFARGFDGMRVMPHDIPADEVIYDYRKGPLRDRDTIVWADDSVGGSFGMSFCGPG